MLVVTPACWLWLLNDELHSESPVRQKARYVCITLQVFFTKFRLRKATPTFIPVFFLLIRAVMSG